MYIYIYVNTRIYIYIYGFYGESLHSPLSVTKYITGFRAVSLFSPHSSVVTRKNPPTFH